jgi:2-polyprenyl-3-methyl-5-hydroxy-6-metoxy-1,4-benzoquinol methylase
MAYKSTYDLNRPWKDVMEELADDDVHEEFYLSGNPLVRYLHNRRIQIIRELIEKDPQTTKSVLEVGCGDGFVLAALSNLNVSLTGVEISEKRVLRAKKAAPAANIILGDARSLDLEAHSFDICICTEVLEHIPDPSRAVNELKRLTRPGGLMIVTVPNERNWQLGRAALLRFPIKIPDHVNAFNVRMMQSMFGLKTEKLFCLPPLSRFFCLTYLFVFRAT